MVIDDVTGTARRVTVSFDQSDLVEMALAQVGLVPTEDMTVTVIVTRDYQKPVGQDARVEVLAVIPIPEET